MIIIITIIMVVMWRWTWYIMIVIIVMGSSRFGNAGGREWSRWGFEMAMRVSIVVREGAGEMRKDLV